MAYVKNPTWQDGVEGGTRIDAANLNNIEDGIEAAHNGLDLKVNVADAVSLAGASDLPLAGGTAFQGTANVAARADHVHPVDPDPACPTIIPGSGRWITPLYGNTTSRPALSLNRLVLCPLYIRTPSRAPLSVTDFGVQVTTAAASSFARFGLYPADASTGMPDWAAKIFDSGDIDTSTTGAKTFTSAQSLAEGLYWSAVVAHGAGITVEGASFESLPVRIYDITVNALVQQKSWRVDSVTGALPTTSPSIVSATDIPPIVFMKVA